MGVLKGREAKQIGGNYATMVNILQYKKGLRVEAKKIKKVGADMEGTRCLQDA